VERLFCRRVMSYFLPWRCSGGSGSGGTFGVWVLRGGWLLIFIFSIVLN
jgi:hypothetical protein